MKNDDIWTIAADGGERTRLDLGERRERAGCTPAAARSPTRAGRVLHGSKMRGSGSCARRHRPAAPHVRGAVARQRVERAGLLAARRPTRRRRQACRAERVGGHGPRPQGEDKSHRLSVLLRGGRSVAHLVAGRRPARGHHRVRRHLRHGAHRRHPRPTHQAARYQQRRVCLVAARRQVPAVLEMVPAHPADPTAPSS